jgi:POT family proton-dependent oligopeptide transporter
MKDASIPVLPIRPNLFGHPKGLTFLILTGMWETSALVGMRTVLVYYLVKQLHMSDRDAIGLYGLFSASGILGIVGGVTADKVLGLRRAVILGTVAMAIGLFALTLPSLLYPALLLIAVGNGFVRPTLAAQVGLLYAIDDPRRDTAFTNYYVGVNVGALVAPLVYGTVGEFYGWSWSFVAAGAGMLLSLLVYFTAGIWIPRSQPQRTHDTSGAATGSDMRNVLLLVLVGLAGVFFFSAYGQIGGTIALWADTGVNRDVVFGAWRFTIPVTWMQSLNPLYVILLVPLVNVLALRFDRTPSAGREFKKMIVGTILLALSFLILAAVSGQGGKASWLWLVVSQLPFTLAELYFTPIGLGVFSKYAVRGFAAGALSLWSVAAMMGNAGSGWLGQLWGRLPASGFFATVAAVAMVTALMLPVARRLSFKIKT